MSIADDERSSHPELNTNPDETVTSLHKKGRDAIRELVKELARESARRDHAKHLRQCGDLEGRGLECDDAGADIGSSHDHENDDDT